MKNYLLLVITFFIGVAATAQQEVFHLNRLPAKDTLLSGWKMYAGDDPRFADPAMDDSKWSPIELDKDIRQYPAFHQAGIIWLRLRLAVDSSIKDKVLAAHIEQFTASEVYLNGVLIQQYGTISKDPVRVVAWQPSAQPFLINLLRDTQNVFAVRVAYQPGLPYISYLGEYLPVFNLFINRHQAAADNFSANEHQVKMYVIIFSVSSGTLLIIGFIYLVFFLFERSRKVNLYYSLCMLAFTLNAMPTEIWGVERYGKVALTMWVFYLEGVALTIGMLFMVLTIYSLFNYPRRAVFKILIALSAAVIIAMYVMGTSAFIAVTQVFPAFYLLEAAYVCVWAIKKHKKDAAIILTGMLFYLVITVMSAFVPVDSISAQLLIYVAQMSFPVGMSFYLGLQSSMTNKKLRTTLAEVQTLSAENLAQEQEKQLLLANQNEMLEQQVTERTAELNRSLQELKATQSQLIQSEKMASLGELTAGIAHEIQNPLNFVNNFSEVSSELIEEMNTELNKGDIEEAKAIAGDIQQNLVKINHHGKRAGAIVKGMLQHSRGSSAVKEPTDINAVADEYLRAAYAGFKAKDSYFNAEIETDFDKSIGNIAIVPQDIGKVLLNLYNNAFYAVTEKKKQQNGNYAPVVSVSTKMTDGKLTITVKDNGTGIPQKIVDKIFQPFFTTKPTGQGTGLGLSLSYDIIKAHGGELKVSTREDGYTEFEVLLSF